MNTQQSYHKRGRLTLWWGVILCTLLTSLLPLMNAQAAPLKEDTATTADTTLELVAVEDQGMIESVPTFIAPHYPYFVINGRNSVNQDWNFIQFDLSVLPADAVIKGAQLKLAVIGFGGPARQIEAGRVDGDWEEGVTSWNTMPPVTWISNTRTITEVGEVTWPLKPLVEAWHSGSIVNNGVVVRGLDNGNGAGSQARTRDGACKDQDDNGVCDYDFDLPPRLIITYSEPVHEGARPDLGDAPDSDSNHVGINNTAYLDGTFGHFPTVREGTPNNQGAGPRHNNETIEAILGDVLSREGEADIGPDQDLNHNNILDGGVDNANRDRGDDGWRNRTATFDHCRRTTLVVRVRKAANAQKNIMYLNGWFDGNNDGDWQDVAPCPPEDGVPAPVANEWIIQDYVVNMAGIPAGGFVDIPINTERVLNANLNRAHWMRLSLSEIPAPSAPGDLPDGRGPHPSGPLGAYAFGETEDYIVKPQSAGENGDLKIQKNVINPSGGVVPIGALFTYEIMLKHDGGTQPIDALIRDELPYGIRIFPQIVNGQIEYIVVSSPTGGVTPLQAEYRLEANGLPLPTYIVGWNGKLAPNAIVKLSFLAQNLGLCPPDQNTQDATNVARARVAGTTGGVSDDATLTIACPGFNPPDIDFEEEPLENPIDLDTINTYPWHGTVLNSHPHTVTLGFYNKPATGEVDASAVISGQKLRNTLILAPGEKKALDLLLPLANDNSGLPADLTAINFCLMVDENLGCPPQAQFPNLHGNVPITPTRRPADLGDAPDNTNHFGANMAAYAGVPALYPTVFDPATGAQQGPRHLHPRAFHLGQQVSREIEADLGPDQDALNNIVPPANDPDNDVFDDGSQLTIFGNCVPARADVQVRITPQAVNYFQNKGTPGYLNVWIDSNRDGDWADGFTCQDPQGQNQSVVEHILIDFPINVVGLGAGLHNLANIPTDRILWPPALANRPTWVRFTLSDQPSNKTLAFAGKNYGDGRGYAQSFKVGETEDYIRYYDPQAMDVAVQLVASTQKVTRPQPGVQSAAVDQLGNFEIQMWRVNVQNLGLTTANNALLEFQIPEHLRGTQPAILKAPGVSSQSISFNFDKLEIALPPLGAGGDTTVVLGWYGCITCTLAASANLDYSASVKLTLAGDADASNNTASATSRTTRQPIMIGAFMDYTDDSCTDRIVTGRAVTNRTSIQLRGKAEPNSIIAILIGLVKVGTVNSDANGTFIYSSNPGAGLLGISAQYEDQLQSAAHSIISPRDPASGQATGKFVLHVDPSLPIDPMSLCFTDSNGKSYYPPILNYSFGATQTGGWLLKPDTTYRMSVYGNGVDTNAALDAGFTLSDDLINESMAKLRDLDGDGLFTGQVTLPKPIPTPLASSEVESAEVQATAKFNLRVNSGGTETSFTSDVSFATEGKVTNKLSGAAVDGASVIALLAQNSDAGVSFVAPAEGTLGQANPTTSAGGGLYSFNVPNGIYRLDVAAAGFQPYRSANIEVSNGLLAKNLALSPVVNEAATQVVYITANGCIPANVTVAPGSVVEFVNIDLADHQITSSQWDSGLLGTGESYKVKLDTAGSFTYTDSEGIGTVAITVGDVPAATLKVFLPVVQK